MYAMGKLLQMLHIDTPFRALGLGEAHYRG